MLSSTKFDHTRFADIADIILNNTIIVAGTQQYAIREIEFYYKNALHPDNYTHCSDEQLQNCKFYFHKFRNGTYKTGTYKGLDITLSPNNETYFGCLIRSIENTQIPNFIEGPCRSVDALLKNVGYDNINDFVVNKQLPLGIYDKSVKIHLEHTPNKLNDTIYCGPRIGLSEKYPDFRNKNYRYATNISRIKKKRKTFVEVNKTE